MDFNCSCYDTAATVACIFKYIMTIPEILCAAIIGIGIILVTVVGIACIFCDRSVPNSLREILISSMVGNFLGIFFVGWGIVARVPVSPCKDTKIERHVLMVVITLVLSLGYIMILAVAEYENVSAPSNQKRKRHYTGLIYVLWTTAFMLGFIAESLLVRASPETEFDARVVIAVLSAVCCYVIVQKYVSIKRSNEKKKGMKIFYDENFLREDVRRTKKITMKQWKFKYTAYVIYSYAVFFTPWAIVETDEGLERRELDMVHKLMLIFYACNFYAIPSACIYLRYKTWKVKRKLRMKLKRYLRDETKEALL